MKERQITNNKVNLKYRLKDEITFKEKLAIVNSVLSFSCNDDINNEYKEYSKIIGKITLEYLILVNYTDIFDKENNDDITIEEVLSLFDKFGYKTLQNILKECNEIFGIVDELNEYLKYEYEERMEIRRLENNSFVKIMNLIKNNMGDLDFFKELNKIQTKIGEENVKK